MSCRKSLEYALNKHFFLPFFLLAYPLSPIIIIIITNHNRDHKNNILIEGTNLELANMIDKHATFLY